MENNTIDKINVMIELMKRQNKNDNKELKITTVKKNNMRDKTLSAYKFKTLFKGAHISSRVLSFVIYKMYKTGLLNDISLINKMGFSINEQKELVDNEGFVIDDEEINKSLALHFKNKLMKNSSQDDNAIVSEQYKKERYKTLLLNMKIKNSVRNLYEHEESAIKKNDNTEMYKGMGKC